MYYLFTSNARPLYIQDALNVLALPRRAIYQFRYDGKYVQESLLDDMKSTGSLKQAQDQEALVIFVTQSEGEAKPDEAVHYYPLRRVSIRSIKLEGRTVCIRFELGDYVDWGVRLGNLDQDARDDEIKKILDESSRPQVKYVVQDALATSSLFRFADADRATAAWQHIVEALNPVTCFKRTVFYRIAGVYEHEEKFISKFLNLFRREERRARHYVERQRQLVSEVLAEMSGYVLRSNTTNMLHLVFYNVDDEHTQFGELVDKKVSIMPKYDQAYFSYSPKPIRVSSRYDDYPIPLVVSSLNADVFTEVEIALSEGGALESAVGSQPLVVATQDGSPKKQNDESTLRAPHVCLILKITHPRAVFYATIFLFGVSQLVTALSGRIAEILKVWGLPDSIVSAGQAVDPKLTVFAPVAAVLAAVALALLLRKVPGGSD